MKIESEINDRGFVLVFDSWFRGLGFDPIWVCVDDEIWGYCTMTKQIFLPVLDGRSPLWDFSSQKLLITFFVRLCLPQCRPICLTSLRECRPCICRREGCRSSVFVSI